MPEDNLQADNPEVNRRQPTYHWLHPLYQKWRQMIGRCCNKNHNNYEDYGGRGITVCERWMTFSNFLADMGERPSPFHSLERIDNERGYEPGNVKWATRAEQSRNKRNSRIYSHNGETMCLADWARKSGIAYMTLNHRVLTLGWDIGRAISTPVCGRGQGKGKELGSRRRYEFQGEMLTIPEISRKTGITYLALRQRLLMLGWSIEEATTTPVRERRKQP